MAKEAAEAISVQVAWLLELPANSLQVLVNVCVSGVYAAEGNLLGPNQKEHAKVTKLIYRCVSHLPIKHRNAEKKK